MAQITFSVRMDETLKREFDALCADFGMSVSTAINVYAKTVVKERKIPFEIAAKPKEEEPLTKAEKIRRRLDELAARDVDDDTVRREALEAFYALREEAKANGTMGMSLEEINEEIDKVRRGEPE